MRLASQPREQKGRTNVLAFADARTTQVRVDDSTKESPFFMSLFRNFTPLPKLGGAQVGVAAAQRLLPGTVVRTGGRATETVMKREAGSYDMLHFATHAVVDEWSGASAALALTPSPTDDGLLNLNEIAHLRVNAFIVLLSACRIIGGKVIAGEWVRGLTSAFLQAGARSVIAPAWRVNDRSVVPVVSALYQELVKRQPVGAALRSAQLAAIRRKVSPVV